MNSARDKYFEMRVPFKNPVRLDATMMEQVEEEMQRAKTVRHLTALIKKQLQELADYGVIAQIQFIDKNNKLLEDEINGR